MNSVEQSVDLRSSENDLANPAISVFRRPFCVLLHIKDQTDCRHSRADGNSDLCISEILKDYCKSKLLDSRLRGNDGGEVFFGFLLSAFYRRILQAEASFRIIP